MRAKQTRSRPAAFATAVFLMASLALMAVPVSAQPASGNAASTVSGGAERNVYAAGAEVRSSSRMDGDFVAVGAKVILDHPVAGDASLAGGSVDVRASVGDDLRALGGDISIGDQVGGEVLATGGSIALKRAAVVGRGATLYGGSVQVEGRVDGDLKASAQRIFIDGEVRGNARLAGEQIELGPRARLGGAVSYASPSELKKDAGAQVAGALTREESGATPQATARHQSWEGSMRGPFWMGGVMSFFALLALAALFTLVVPRFENDAATRIQTSPWRSLAVGFGTAVAVPMLAVLLFVTVLGIPLGIALMALYPALLLGGFVVGVQYVARLLVKALRREHPRNFVASMGYFALALLLMLLVASVPFIGAALTGMLGLAGVGACVLELRARRDRPPPADGAKQERPVFPTLA